MTTKTACYGFSVVSSQRLSDKRVYLSIGSGLFLAGSVMASEKRTGLRAEIRDSLPSLLPDLPQIPLYVALLVSWSLMAATGRASQSWVYPERLRLSLLDFLTFWVDPFLVQLVSLALTAAILTVVQTKSEARHKARACQ